MRFNLIAIRQMQTLAPHPGIARPGAGREELP